MTVQVNKPGKVNKLGYKRPSIKSNINTCRKSGYEKNRVWKYTII